MTGNFIEIPSSVTIEAENGVEMDAVFRCHHQRIDAGISWLINGLLSSVYPDVVDSFIRDSSGMRVDTLTIPAISEYNETEIVCVATFIDGSPHEVTPPADLIIMGMLAYRVFLLDVFFIVLTLLIVTREAATQPPPTITIEPGKAGSFCGLCVLFIFVCN